MARSICDGMFHVARHLLQKTFYCSCILAGRMFVMFWKIIYVVVCAN